MRYVRSAVRRPHRCAAIGFIGMNHAEGYIDTETEFEGERVYISVVGVKEMAKIIGLPTRADYESLLKELDKASAELLDVQEALGDATSRLDAIHVLKAAGYSAQRKPGRKTAEKVEA